MLFYSGILYSEFLDSGVSRTFRVAPRAMAKSSGFIRIAKAGTLRIFGELVQKLRRKSV
jgi:hypothetical protein